MFDLPSSAPRAFESSIPRTAVTPLEIMRARAGPKGEAPRMLVVRYGRPAPTRRQVEHRAGRVRRENVKQEEPRPEKESQEQGTPLSAVGSGQPAAPLGLHVPARSPVTPANQKASASHGASSATPLVRT